ncbi:MAG: glycoside hydrolase [Gemmatimonadaceae bacterium]|nr:glycoside hydrolase [Gemmatimonadaceae bacterium]
MRFVRPLVALGALVGPALGAQAPSPAAALDSLTIAGLRWRAIGPANMGGRVTDVEGIPSPSKTFYVATAGGGIWKTTNAGTTFKPIFENERCVAMGDLAIAPSDTNVIYAGTGEQNSRNSISPGCGVYKSTDGGKTWSFLGLRETEHIGRIQVHPTNPNIVYMAVLGSAWRPSKERGLYKSVDGGKTWSIAKFISEKAGFIDVQLDPRNPDVIWASSYERQRGPYFLQSGGPGSALWKSTDAGATWTQVKGGGLPESTLGRVEIAIARSNPEVMYLMVEADTMPNAKPEKGKKAQVRPSGLYRSADGGKTWEKRNGENVRPFYYSQVRVDPKNPERVYWSSTPVKFSDDGGKTARDATVGIHVDHHAMWIDPNDPEHFIVGNDGGVAQTWDRGGNYDVLNIINIGQFYAISFDMAQPYNVCGGLQDNGSWCGPSRKVRGPIGNEAWRYISGGDGFYTAQDPTDPDIVYSESQGGNIGRLNMATGERTSLVKPSWRSRFLQWEDSILIERPDTTAPMSKAQKARVDAFRARQKADSAEADPSRRRPDGDLARPVERRPGEAPHRAQGDGRHHPRPDRGRDLRHDHRAGRVAGEGRHAPGRHR